MSTIMNDNLRNNLKEPSVPVGKKVLRVGIIESGKLSDERIFRREEAVTVGESHRNSFVMMDLGLPSRFPLFEFQGGQYFLNISEKMTGKISQGGAAVDLQTLQPAGGEVGEILFKDPQEVDEKAVKLKVYRVPLGARSRGKLQFGAVTLLFQFITPPPVPKPIAGAQMFQSSWFMGVDWMYASVLLVSFLAHSGFVFVFQKMGPLVGAPEHISKRFDPNRMPGFFIPPKPVVTKKVMVDKKAPGKEKDKPKAKADRARPRKNRGKATKTPQRMSRANLAKRMESVGVLRILGVVSKDGRYQNLFRGGEDALSRSLDDVGSVTVATAGKRWERRCTVGCETRKKLSITDRLIGPEGGRDGGGTEKKRKKVRLKKSLDQLKIEKIDNEDGGSLNPKRLEKMLYRKRWEVISCYEQQLKRSPGLQGKLGLRIKINLKGRAYEVEVDEDRLNNQKVSTCIVRRIKRWLFPRPQGENASIVVPFVFTPRQ